MRPLGAACAHAPHTHFHIQVNTLTQHINISPFLLYSLWSTIFKSCFSKSNQILVKSLKPSITLNSKTKSHIKRSRHHNHMNSIHLLLYVLFLVLVLSHLPNTHLVFLISFLPHKLYTLNPN